jgi:hypothetical protein
MSEPAAAKLALVRQLIERASDSVVRNLEQALMGDGGYSDSSAALFEMISKESRLRRARSVVFAPIMGPFTRRQRPLPTLQYPTETLKVLWRDLYDHHADLLDEASVYANAAPTEDSARVYDQVCIMASEALLDDQAPHAAALVEGSPGGVVQLAQLLHLAPILRGVIPKLDGWLRNLNGDNVASIRLAFKDAAVVYDDGGYLLMETLSAQMAEPWQVLRLISAVMDRPSDRYLAASELAVFGTRILADTASRIEAVRRFDPSAGVEAGVAAAQSIFVAVQQIAEFEQWIALDRDTGWGQQIFELKRTLAANVEARLKDVEPAVGQALPLAGKPFGAKSLRAPARLTEDPNPAVIRKAEGLLAFTEGVRSSATLGGYGSFRAKVAESIGERLDHYTEDLIDRLLTDTDHNAPPQARVRAYLHIAARFVAQVCNPKQAEIIRRRSASASAAAA